MVASLLTRWLLGTLHYGVSEAHLPYYLDEYTFRFNRRTARSRGLLFYRLLQQAVNTDPHPLATLLRPGAPTYGHGRKFVGGHAARCRGLGVGASSRRRNVLRSRGCTSS